MVAQAPPLVRSGLSTSMPVLNAEPPPVPRKDSELRADAALRARCADLEQRIAQYQRALHALRLKETEVRGVGGVGRGWGCGWVLMVWGGWAGGWVGERQVEWVGWAGGSGLGARVNSACRA